MRRADKLLAITGCCTAIATLVPVALFQSGALDTLPDPPGVCFDSERITLSRAAHPFGIPDSYLGLASYATTLALLLTAGKNRTSLRLLGAKLSADAAAAGFNATRQVVSFGKICSWCSGTALATVVMAYGARAVIADTAKAAVKAI